MEQTQIGQAEDWLGTEGYMAAGSPRQQRPQRLRGRRPRSGLSQ
jgi:hypothetical protein